MPGMRLLMRSAAAAAGCTAAAGAALTWNPNNVAKKEERPRGGALLTLVPRLMAQTAQHPNADPLDPHRQNWTPAKWDDDWDRRHEGYLKAKKEKEAAKARQEKGGEEKEKIKGPTATRHILLIRHGQYNLKGKNDSEKYLTQLGRDQATLTGKRLRELDLPWTHVFVSTMTRAKETKELICSELGLGDKVKMGEPDEILKEGAPIRPEPDVISWRPEHHYSTDGARIEAAFRKYFHRADATQTTDSHELVVCHANVIRYFVCRALQLPPEAWLRISLRHASVTWVVVRPDGTVSVRGLGDAGHFPPEMLTTS